MYDALQYLLAGIIVALAVGHVLRRAWLLLHGKSAGACGGCNRCAAAVVVPRETLIRGAVDPSGGNSDPDEKVGAVVRADQ